MLLRSTRPPKIRTDRTALANLRCMESERAGRRHQMHGDRLKIRPNWFALLLPLQRAR